MGWLGVMLGSGVPQSRGSMCRCSPQGMHGGCHEMGTHRSGFGDPIPVLTIMGTHWGDGGKWDPPNQSVDVPVLTMKEPIGVMVGNGIRIPELLIWGAAGVMP